MRRSERLSTILLTGMLATVSCAVVPAAPRSDAWGLAGGAGSHPQTTAADSASIARTLSRWETGLDAVQSGRLARVIAIEARAAGVPPALVLAIIEVESSGRSFAVSPVGARGLMQLLPATGAFVAERADLPWHGPATLFDPVANVRLGIRYLQHLIRRYPDVRVALAAYNAGPGAIAERLARGEPLPRRYADRVLAASRGAGREI